MISLRLRVLLFIVQTTSIYVRGSQEQNRSSDASPDTMRYAAKNATSFLISPSVYHHHTFLDSTSILATKSGSDGHNFLGSRSSQLVTYLHVLVTLNTITQSTSAFSSSAPETLLLSSEEISRNTNTELSSKARNSLVAWDKKSTVYNDSQVISTSMVNSSEQLHLMTLNMTRHSAYGLTTHATNHSLKHSHFLTNIYSSVSLSQHKTRTERIIQKESTTQTKLNALSRSTTNSFPLESSKAYQTNSLYTKSVEQSAQISRSSSNITTLQRKNISTSASSLLYLTNSYEHSSHVFRTSSNNLHSPPSSTNTVQEKASAMSRHGAAPSLSIDKNVSYHSTISSLFSSSILNSLDYNSQINPTPALTRSQNITKTTSVKKITRTLSIVPSTTLINTVLILKSESHNTISQSSHWSSVRSEQRRRQKSDPNSSSTINNGGKPEIIQSSSLSIIVHSTHLSQKPASETVIKHSPKYSDRNPSMPIYVLAIFLPLALLLGFLLAFLYFKRSKLDQRTQYSVTVEVTSECPDYEMKRMYSVIDVNAGNINKDFCSGLESDNSTSSILSSVSLTPATGDQIA